jgi:hypothetical protein
MFTHDVRDTYDPVLRGTTRFVTLLHVVDFLQSLMLITFYDQAYIK